MDIATIYDLIKSFHIIFMTTWMAGLFYLPRLFVYHASIKKNSSSYKTFTVMEKKLFLYIMNPSLVLTWLLGLSLIHLTGSFSEFWLLVKLILVMMITVFHIYCGRLVKEFEKKKNKKNDKYFRIINEVPTIIFIVIIFLVVFKPLIDR